MTLFGLILWHVDTSLLLGHLFVHKPMPNLCKLPTQCPGVFPIDPKRNAIVTFPPLRSLVLLLLNILIQVCVTFVMLIGHQDQPQIHVVP
jgi:hypothetical protein